MPITAPSALFDKTTATTGFLNAIARTGLPGLTADSFGPDEAWALLLAAEKDAERQLRCFLSPTIVFPQGVTQAEVDALPQGTRWIEDAGYDYDPEMFTGDSWGFISTHFKPVVSIERLFFQYPAPQQTVFDVPMSWVRCDKKYGHIRLVPASQSFSAPLSAFMMQAMGGGRTIPFMLQVKYVSGLKDAASEYPELVDLIKKMAVLRAINDTYPASSGSISADGLSESSSFDLDKYQAGVDAALDKLRDAIHGVRMAFL